MTDVSRPGPAKFVFIHRGSRHCYRARSNSAHLLIFILPGGLEEFFREVDALLAEGMTSYEARATLAGRHHDLPNPDRSLFERPLSHIEKSGPSGRLTLRACPVWVCSNWKACTEGLCGPTAELTA
jgi:hypothetical protein